MTDKQSSNGGGESPLRCPHCTKRFTERRQLQAHLVRHGEPREKEKRMAKPILCLDFDGVIHSYTSGWQGAIEIPDRPVDGAFEFIREAQAHFVVAIFSSRSHAIGGILAMQRWMDYYNDDHSVAWIDLIQWPTEKPPAFLTLDDRAIQFKGVWPEMSYLLKFRPWSAAEK